MRDRMLSLDRVTKDYAPAGAVWRTTAQGAVRALDGVSLAVSAGETVAIVGESGSGKSTLLRIAIGIEAPTAGSVRHEGRDLRSFDRPAWRAFRGAVQPVFQDPWGSLNPRMRARQIVAEPLECLLRLERAEVHERTLRTLVEVGLGAEHLERFPHEFSGGQRQRIAIARALALRPRLVVLDEPVSALDVSVRAQIVNLLKDLQAEHGLAYLLVSHDMLTVWSLSDRVLVMYRGRVLESGPAEVIRERPLSPYTRRLVGSVLPVRPGIRRPSPAPAIAVGDDEAMREGCPFRASCPEAFERCAVETPRLTEVAAGHAVACHHVSDKPAQVIS